MKNGKKYYIYIYIMYLRKNKKTLRNKKISRNKKYTKKRIVGGSDTDVAPNVAPPQNTENNAAAKEEEAYFSRAKDIIQAKIQETNQKGDKKDKWVECLNCTEIAELIKTELSSTEYILSVLVKSFLKASTSKTTISFKFELKDMTGLWEQDKDKIEMVFSPPINQKQKQRLIMGFGPSSSGKTYCAQKMIDVFSKSSPNFPQNFITIDGGIYREASKIYQMIVATLRENGIAGFSNLVVAGLNLTKTSLFNSDSTKKIIIEYLKKYRGKISLYVPEVLSSCGYTSGLGLDKCDKKYEPYIEITGDRTSWIGLLIWQHKEGKNCNFTDPYKCLGCTESGTQRQISEGKQYSNTAWQHSMDQGLIAIKNAPGGGYKIHSTGGKKWYVNNTTEQNCLIVIEVVKKPSPNLPNIDISKYLPGTGMVMMKPTFIEPKGPSRFGFM